MSIKRVINITLIAVSLLVSGCFDSNKSLTSDKGKGVELVRNENSVTVNAKEEFSGASFVISQEIDNSNIVTEVDKLKLTKKADGKTYIQIVDMDEPLKEGEKIFEIKNCREKIEVKMEESITERSFEKELSKLQSRTVKKGVRAGTTDELLGDFNSDSKVDIQDFVLFQSGYGTNSTVYDIAPAVKGSAAPYTDVYSKRTPDGVVDLFDFLIFAKNYGKNIVNLPTVTEVVLSGTATVEVDSSISIYAKVKYSNNTEKSEVVNWSSSNESVAVLTANGEWATVTGKGAGAAVIKAEKDGKIGEFNVTVTPKGTVALNSIVVEGDRSVAPGASITVTAKGMFADGTENAITPVWSSSNTALATVDSTGKVTGVAGGTVKIYAEKSGIKTEKTVLVKAAIDGMIIHCKSSTYVPYIWAWGTSGTANYTTTKAWPGDAMTLEAGTTDWYKYTISSTTLGTAADSNIIFSNKGASQTATMVKTKGEWWYSAGAWSDVDPNTDIDAPVVSSTPAAGKVESTTLNVTLTATDNKDSAAKIYYTKDGTIPTTSSSVYSGGISLTQSSTVKAIAVDGSGNVSRIYVFSYELGVDLTAPVVTATPAAGRYETAQNVTLNVTDNKDSGLNIYYTVDGSEPKAELLYLYNGQTISVTKPTTIRAFAQDKSGNGKIYDFNYFIGKVTATRFDPRQESIYFLLTTRWFDGDKSNSVGDEWCSWTEARSKDAIIDDGFTGPEDVTWRGDFKGLVEKMDYIKALGFTTIWITPIVQNRSPLSYHGYHAWDFTKEDARLVSPGYGFQRVIDEAHARGMKVCLDIVLNHSGRFGIKNFAEIKYNRDPKLYPAPDEWSGFAGFDENRYKNGLSQNYPNGWEFDGLHSAGTINGKPLPAYAAFKGDVRPFTTEDEANYPGITTQLGSNGYLKYEWPSTESYCLTIDGKVKGEPNSLDYEGYKNSKRRLRGHNTGFPTGSGSFDNYPDTHFDSLHEDCPDLNIENPEVQQYLLNAYYRYIDMGVDMFRVDTVMHMHKKTLNEMYWPQLLARAEQSKAARGGADFFIMGEVGNFVNNLSDKPAELRQSNYTWDNTILGQAPSNNHLLDGNNYRTLDYSKKAPNASSPYVVSVIDIISHNGFADGIGGAYGRALGNDRNYMDATYLGWYTDSHDYGPNKMPTRWNGDFAGAWSMLFTFRGIPIVYYGSEIGFAQGKPIDYPGGGSAGTDMSLEKTGRAYYGPNLEGTVTATNFGEYTATGKVAETLNSDLSKHLIALNKIRLAVPALQMGQYSTDGHSGGWAGYKRRYTGKNKITGENIDSYALVGVGAGTHSWSGVLDGTYKNILTGATVTASGGNISAAASGSGTAALLVLVKEGLTTPAPAKIEHNSPYLK